MSYSFNSYNVKCHLTEHLSQNNDDDDYDNDDDDNDDNDVVDDDIRDWHGVLMKFQISISYLQRCVRVKWEYECF